MKQQAGLTPRPTCTIYLIVSLVYSLMCVMCRIEGWYRRVNYVWVNRGSFRKIPKGGQKHAGKHFGGGGGGEGRAYKSDIQF